MSFKNIVVVGGGVLGTQIAYQTAYCGFNVKILEISEEAVAQSKPKLDKLQGIYLAELEGFKAKLGHPIAIRMFPKGIHPNPETLSVEKIDELQAQVKQAITRIQYTVDMKEACEDADLVIEAISENPAIKTAFYEKLSGFLPEKTIVCTNSSTRLPSEFAEATKRPEKYLAIHFANRIWKGNTAEVMGHAGTGKVYYDQVAEFAAQIQMVPLLLKKEQPGYILNTMLVAFLDAAQELLGKDVADPETIDKTWVLATGSPMGPFQILDVIGLRTAYHVVMNHQDSNDPESVHYRVAQILKSYIDAGKTGMEAGEGFYKYH